MADWWDWSGESADRELARRQSMARQALGRLEGEYDRHVAEARRAQERAAGARGGTPWDKPAEPFYRQLSPEVRMAHMWDSELLSPKNPSPGYADFLGEVINYPLEIGSRPRDTLLRSAPSFAQGDLAGGLGYAAAAPVSALVPLAAAGRPGDDDDWRPVARANNVSERDIMLIDIGTDPTTYMGWGALRALPRAASRADDILRALKRYGGELRYGQGVPTYIEDAAGNVLSRARNSPGGVLSPLALPSP